MNPVVGSHGSMPSCCTCCTAVSFVRRKPLPLQAIRSRPAGGADRGRPRAALGLTVQARTAARVLVPAGFSIRRSSRPSTIQVTSPETTGSTNYELASGPVAHQPFKSPRQLTYTSGTHQAKAAYRGNDRSNPSPFSGRRNPESNGEMRTSDDDETDRGGTSCRWLRAHYRLVVSVRWCILKSVPGAQLTTNPKRYQVDSSTKALQVLATESASMASLTWPDSPFSRCLGRSASPRRRQFDRRPRAQKTP